ncbi:DUF4345 family protein [Bythopirellula polymerisocia]|uniref:DUF4345 domain-containing protein n=1 Tax=Bythopirellula polymerisocia TaxID=2528003 RepID=A0A5C6D337_9BACT|nr:DUF4345 family protein [Bythopirellula polymerisocia]TWU29626.1 hypothetical protein Pla144_04040 [Bythopirellula polymerisocia]
MTRTYLAIVGIIYLLLALWCALQPTKTAGSIGFELRPGSGESEYFTVYGGLQLALGLVFLLPMVRPEFTSASLLVCLLVHASLAIMRTLSLLLFSGVANPTWYFAATEWILFLATLGFWWKNR